MFNRIKVLYRSVVYTLRTCYEYERGIHELRRHAFYWKLNPWIEYVAIHSQLNYLDAIEIYNVYNRLSIASTRKRAKMFTKLVIDMAGCGCSVSLIKGYLIAALEEAEKEI